MTDELLEQKFWEMDKALQEYIENADEAYDNDNLRNLASNSRSIVEQLCNMTFIQYDFNQNTTIKDKIDYLEQNNIVTSDEAAILQKVRLTGNAMIHGDGEVRYDIKELYVELMNKFEHITDEMKVFLSKEDKPQTLGNPQESFHKEYEFKDYVFGFSPKQNLIIEGEFMYVYSKNGGTVNINSISRVALVEATKLKSGSLYFFGSAGAVGVTWSTLTENKKMNENAREIAEYVQDIINNKSYRTSSPNQTINNITMQTSPADEVKKLKELLDMGVITQEEFDKKKKELLNL